MDKPEDELKKIVSRWQTAYFMGQALLEDYAERMAKLEGSDPSKIKEAVNNLTQKKFDEFKKSNPIMALPKEIKQAQEVWIPYAVSVCKKLSIPYNTNHIDIDKAFNDIKTTDPEVNQIMWDYFTAFETYSLYYHALKRNEPGTMDEYYRLEKEMNDKQQILDDLLK